MNVLHREQFDRCAARYLMVSCLNKLHGFGENLSRILQILSVNVFQKEPINQMFTKFETRNDEFVLRNQLMLKGF